VKRQLAVFLTLVLFIVAPFLSASAQGEPLHVVATTTIIADVARNVGGDLVEVTALIPMDADVHAFQPTPNDAALIADADILLVSGAGLESFLGELIENVGGVQPVVVSNGIEMLAFGEHEEEHTEDTHQHEAAEHIGVLGVDAECEHEEEHEVDEHEHGGCDPHVWTDPNNVKIWAANIAEAFAAADGMNAETYAANAAAYIEQLTALDTEVREILSSIPEDQRILVTNHEFLSYFAHTYDF
jgi:zinc/manganese transport system substrate-binding protein